MKIKGKFLFAALCLIVSCLVLGAVGAADVNDTATDSISDGNVAVADNSVDDSAADEISDVQTQESGNVIADSEDTETADSKGILKSGKDNTKLGYLYINGTQVEEFGQTPVYFTANEEYLLNFTDSGAKEGYYIMIDMEGTKNWQPETIEENRKYLPIGEEFYYNTTTGIFQFPLKLPMSCNGYHIIISEFNNKNSIINGEWGGQHIQVFLSKAQSSIAVDVDENQIPYINLTTASGSVIPNATVNYTVNGAEYNGTTDENGIIRLDNLTGSKFAITASYADNDNYVGSNITENIYIVDKIPERVETRIVSSDFKQTAVDSHNGEHGGYFTVNLTDADGNPLANKHVQIGFNGVIYNRTTDFNGVALLPINLASAGTYTFATAFLGDDNYKGSFAVNKITISKKPSKLTLTGNTAGKVNQVKTLTVRLTGKNALNSGYRNAVGKKITLKVNGKTYTAKTNSNGVATFKVKISKAGTYTISTSFAGDGTFSSKSLNSKITIRR